MSGGTTDRRLGLPSATVLVVASMVGAGVFTTSGFALADLGSRRAVLLAWLVGGVVAMCGALSYGALARRLPESGGEYLFLARTFHPLVGFLAGWISLLAGFTAPIAVAALALQAYLADSFGFESRPEWIGTTAIVTAGVMHGVRRGGGVVLQNIAVAVKLVLIGGFVAVGAARLPPRAPAEPVSFELGAFAVALVWISYSYSGWNAAVYVASEVRDPRRNVRRSLWTATAAVTAVYLAINAVFLYAAPVEQLAGRAEIGAVAAEALGGVPLRRAVSLLVALALFTSISSMIMAGPRLYARMAADGLLPRVLATGSETPFAAVALQVALAVLVVWLGGLVELLGYVGFTLGLSTAASVVALLILRRREGPARVPVPGHPWLPGLFVAVTLGASGFLVVRQPLQAGAGLLTVATALPVYWLMRWRRRDRRR